MDIYKVKSTVIKFQNEENYKKYQEKKDLLKKLGITNEDIFMKGLDKIIIESFSYSYHIEKNKFIIYKFIPNPGTVNKYGITYSNINRIVNHLKNNYKVLINDLNNVINEFVHDLNKDKIIIPIEKINKQESDK